MDRPVLHCHRRVSSLGSGFNLTVNHHIPLNPRCQHHTAYSERFFTSRPRRMMQKINIVVSLARAGQAGSIDLVDLADAEAVHAYYVGVGVYGFFHSSKKLLGSWRARYHSRHDP